MAVPTSYLDGQRLTSNVTDATIREVQQKIIWIQPDRSPFVSLLMRLGTKETPVPKFEFFEDDLILPICTNQNSAITSVTTLQLATGESLRLAVNYQLYNLATSEILRVLSVNTANDTITVSRGAASSTAATIAASQQLVISSEAREEGVQLASAVTTNMTNYFNYIEEFETAVEMSWLQQGVKTYTEPDWDYQIRKGAVEHKEKMERALWFGGRDLQSNGQVAGNRVYYTGGAKWFIDTFVNVAQSANIVSMSGPLTQFKLEDWLENVLRFGNPNRKVFFTSPFGKLILTRLAGGAVRTTRSEDTLGLTITTVEILGFMIPIVTSLFFPRINYNNTIFLLDMDYIRLRTLAANGMNFSVRWFRNVQIPDLKGRKDVLHCIQGLEMQNDYAHGYLTGFSG